MRSFLHDIFHDPRHKYFSAVNNALALLTIISIIGIICESVEDLSLRYGSLFLIIEYTTAFLFGCEYIGRIFATRTPLRYICSFFGIVDLITFLPTLLGLSNFTFLKSIRILRILRFLRVIRIAHVIDAREHTTKAEKEHDATSLTRITIEIYVIAFVASALISASMMWHFEGTREVFRDIPHALLWSSKVLLGGAFSHGAETVVGEIVVILTRFTSLVLFGLLLSIVGRSVRLLLFGEDVRSS